MNYLIINLNFFQNVFELYQNGLHIWQLGYIQLSHSSGTGPSEWWRKFVSGRQGFPWRWAKDMQKYLHLSLSAGSFACEMLAIAPVVKHMQQEEEAQRSEMAAILCGQNAHVSSATDRPWILRRPLNCLQIVLLFIFRNFPK